jgi:hypothetical protein
MALREVSLLSPLYRPRGTPTQQALWQPRVPPGHSIWWSPTGGRIYFLKLICLLLMALESLFLMPACQGKVTTKDQALQLSDSDQRAGCIKPFCAQAAFWFCLGPEQWLSHWKGSPGRYGVLCRCYHRPNGSHWMRYGACPYHLPGMWLWKSFLTSLTLTFLTRK